MADSGPIPTKKLCWNCGSKTFWYEKAYRCIFCGGYMEGNKPTEPMEMYLCPSYINDAGELVDCKCGGKCND